MIDDQHLAHKEVNEVVEAFIEFHLQGRAAARLIVASITTYAPTRALTRGRSEGPLNQATPIPLQPASSEDMTTIVDVLRMRCGLATPLSDEELASLSDGKVGLALILARCANDLRDPVSFRRLCESRHLGEALEEWILIRIGRDGNHEFFQSDIAPVLIVAGYGLSVPQDFSKAIVPLHEAGFLEPDEQGTGTDTTFHPISLNLAVIVAFQYSSLKQESLSLYLSKYPRLLPAICERLADSDPKTFHEFIEGHFHQMVSILNDRQDPISLVGVNKVLSAVHSSARRESIRLLREIAAPKGQPNLRFFADFLSLERIINAASLKTFFEMIHRIDRAMVRRLVNEQPQLGKDREQLIENLFELPSCRLDQIAACLHAIRRCSRELAARLYEKCKLSSAFGVKVAQTDADPRWLSIWLRFCEGLRTVNRLDCYDYLEQHLSTRKVIDAVLFNQEFNVMSLYLARVRRLKPKLAADVLSTIWRDNRDTLQRLLSEETDLSAVSNELYAMSRINRRVAVEAALRSQTHICNLMHEHDRYDKIGAAVESFRKNIGGAFAQVTAQALNREGILPLVQQEHRRFDLVGKFLYYLALASPDTASWFEERLEYETYLRRLRDMRLRSLVYITRGFLSATKPQRKADLVEQFLSDNQLVDEFSKAWNGATSLTEIAFCLSLLMSGPLEKLQILSLLGIPNLASLESDIRERCSKEKSLLHITNGLFAVAKFDLHIGIEILRQYVLNVQAEVRSRQVEQSGPPYQRRFPRMPQGYEPNNLVELGCLLRVAATIEPSQARELANLLDLASFTSYATDEANLGRLAIFILGLHEASRKLARDFVQATCTEDSWQAQCDENEELENVIHYARALGRVSAKVGGEFVRFVTERYQKDIDDYLEMEANLLLVSNWLRVLPMGGQDLVSRHVQGMSRFLLPTAEYDTHLRHLLETSEALLECGRPDLSKQFALKALKEATQTRSIRNLHDWIVLFHKCVRIGRELNMPDFTSRVFAKVEDWHLAVTLAFESNAVLSAYTYHLLTSIDIPGIDRLKQAARRQYPGILDSAQQERSCVLRAIALTLVGAPLDDIKTTADTPSWNQSWERGLTAILFATKFPEAGNPFLMPLNTESSEWETLVENDLNDHVGNLEFGLTLNFAAMTGLPRNTLSRLSSITSERMRDELLGATRWLLQQKPGEFNLNQLNHYTWVFLKESILRPAYLSWESEVEAAMDSAQYKQEYVRNPRTMLASM